MDAASLCVLVCRRRGPFRAGYKAVWRGSLDPDGWGACRQDGARRDLAAERGLYEMVEVLDTYVPQLEQALLGMHGRGESPLTRFASHAMFEPQVLWIVAALHSGKSSHGAFDELQREPSE